MKLLKVVLLSGVLLGAVSCAHHGKKGKHCEGKDKKSCELKKKDCKGKDKKSCDLKKKEKKSCCSKKKQEAKS